jgi:branched-chain amino acid aminotransferase
MTAPGPTSTERTNTDRGEIEFDVRPSDHPVAAAERDQLLANPAFGTRFTDHMITLRWTQDAGWHDGRLEAYGPFTLDPATAVFHYAQEFFEGLKAFRQDSGSIVMFRPQANAGRFNRSARRMAMPELPEEAFVQALELLVTQDREWVPSQPEMSLYLRPFLIATQAGLGVNHPSSSYLFSVIASPAGAYFSGGVKPVTVWLCDDYTRAAPGGTGAVKCGGNYAAAFVAQREAVENGCDQVVWLDSAEHRWVEEMGGMNLFFVYGSGDKARIMTPSLTGTLLPGITRDSLLQLAPQLGVQAVEGRISTDQWKADCASGELTEVFACGTAAVITPVGRAKGPDGEFLVGDGTPGPVTTRLRDELLGLQYGTRPDPFGWIHKVC